MQDRNANTTVVAVRRAVLCALSILGVLAAAVVARALGWPTGLGLLGVVTLVLVVILLAAAPDDDGAGASDPAS